MSASRALPEGLDANDETAVGLAQPRRASDAHTGHARRTDAATSTCGTARRAAVEHIGFEPATATLEARPACSAEAFVPARRRRSGGRRLVASLGLLVAVGALSGSAIVGSSALSAAPAQTPAAAATREVSVSRDADRPAPRTPLSSTRVAASGDLTVEVSSAAALEGVAAKAVESTKAVTARPITESVEPAAPVPTVAENIAPGQLPAASVEEAMAKAASMTGNWGYQNMCLSLVATFYGYTSAGEVGAQQAAATISAAGQMHTDLTNIPVGALIWYDGTPVGNPYGHVAMYAGDGMVFSNGAPTGVGLIPLHEPADGWGEPIIGWSSVWLPTATK